MQINHYSYRNNILKLVKVQSYVAKCCKMRKIIIALQYLQILCSFVLRAEITTISALCKAIQYFPQFTTVGNHANFSNFNNFSMLFREYTFYQDTKIHLQWELSSYFHVLFRTFQIHMYKTS